MNLLKRIFLKKLESKFIDRVNGEMVFMWEDQEGNKYLAQNRFRLLIKQQ